MTTGYQSDATATLSLSFSLCSLLFALSNYACKQIALWITSPRVTRCDYHHVSELQNAAQQFS